jgi:hypothetical protein
MKTFDTSASRSSSASMTGSNCASSTSTMSQCAQPVVLGTLACVFSPALVPRRARKRARSMPRPSPAGRGDPRRRRSARTPRVHGEDGCVTAHAHHISIPACPTTHAGSNAHFVAGLFIKNPSGHNHKTVTTHLGAF